MLFFLDNIAVEPSDKKFNVSLHYKTQIISLDT